MFVMARPRAEGRMSRTRSIVAAMAMLGLAGCQQLGVAPGDVGAAVGAGVGGYLGGYLGSQVGTGPGRDVATIAGAAAGAIFGAAIGRKLTESDLTLMGEATQQTLESSPSGSATAWRNPDSGNAGSVVAEPAYQADGQPCRPFRQTVVIEGEVEAANGIACRKDDGSWEIRPG
jgi:surface antigen